jgi:hypothetical protein
MSLSEAIVPLGVAAIGVVAFLKIRRGCPCKKREGERFTNYPQHWRNRVGHREAIPFEQNQDLGGEARFVPTLLVSNKDGALKMPVELSRGPTLHPGMLNPAGERYELQKVFRIIKEIAKRPPPQGKQGFKKAVAARVSKVL